MLFISVAGFLVVAGALVYLAAHGIMKLNNPARTLARSKFYPLLIGGLLAFIFGLTWQTGAKADLEEAMKSNSALEAENDKLRTEVTDLSEDGEVATKEIETLTSRVKELEEESTAVEKKEAELKEKEQTYATEKSEFEQKLAELEKDKLGLESKVKQLEGQVASAASRTTSQPATVSSAGQTASAPASGRTFANCTELRTVHPQGVPSDHPDYQPSMDRDKDGWACER